MKYFLFLLIPIFTHATPGFNCKIITQSEFAATASSAVALAVNGNRRCFMVQNKSGADIFLKYNSVHTASEGIKLANGEIFEPAIVPMSSVYIETATGSGAVVVIAGE